MNLAQYIEESNEQDTLTLYWRFTVGATGALTSKRTKGMKSSLRNGAGDYTFTLVGPAPGKLIATGGGPIGTVGANGAVPNCTVDSSDQATPTVRIVFTPLNSTTPTDVTNGSDLLVTLTFKNGVV